VVHKVGGEEALEYLKDKRNEKPSVMLLDLNMPRMDGLEFLKTVKTDVLLKAIPEVVLTTSETDHSIVANFELNVAGYIVKSVGYKRFIETMRAIQAYWTLSKVPT
jgi:CheY-like chemotaxis protein